MTIENARQLVPLWAEQDKVRVYKQESGKNTYERKVPKEPKKRASSALEQFKRKYGILLIAALAFTLYTIILTANVEARTEKRVRQDLAVEYASQLERYKAEQREAEQASYFLSGNASREAFLNQEIDAAAHFIAEEANETMKGTKLGVAIARLMAGGYGSTLKEVFNQPNQWMFYSGEDNKFTQSDRDFAEGIVRKYYEESIIPNDLTVDIQWMRWTPGDYQGMNNWNEKAATKTWRYHG